MPSRPDERLIILDTNAYLRLADSFHPLIERPFGKPPWKLRVIPDLDRELKRNPRLASKFRWAILDKYADDRRHYLRVSREKREEIEANYDYLRGTADELELTTSPTDMFCLAYALALSAIVISDDIPMIVLAFEFEIPILRTIDMLKLLVDEGRASLKEIQDAIAVMEYRDDIPEPKEFWKKCARYFDMDSSALSGQ